MTRLLKPAGQTDSFDRSMVKKKKQIEACKVFCNRSMLFIEKTKTDESGVSSVPLGF